MTILRAVRPTVKLASKPRKSLEFSPTTYPPAPLPLNILRPSPEELADLSGPLTSLLFDDHRGLVELDEALLATLDPTHSLTADEREEIMLHVQTVERIYGSGVTCPAPDELQLVRIDAATVAIKSVLKARPRAVCCDANEPKPCTSCVGTDATVEKEEEESDPANWPAWTDEFVWEPIEPEVEEPRLTLAALVDSEAAVLRARGLAAYELMADALTDLARIVRTVDAVHPNQVWARVDALDRGYTEEAVAREPELNSAGQWA